MSSERRLTAMRPVLPFSLVPFCLCAMLAACTDFPEFDGAQSRGVASAPWPDLVPMSDLLAAPAPVRAQPETSETLTARAEALRRRAAGLQGGEVVASGARGRMRQGVRTEALTEAAMSGEEGALAPDAEGAGAADSSADTAPLTGTAADDQTDE